MNSLRQQSTAALRIMCLARSTMLAMIVGALLLGVACGSGSDSGAPTLDNPTQTGQQLVEKYMSLLADQNVDGLKDFLSDAFIRQGAEGMFAAKDDYLNNLPQLSKYTISDVTGKQAGDALVVRWLFSVEEVIAGKTLQTEPAPRLATFVWDGGGWKLLSHANFNRPVE